MTRRSSSLSLSFLFGVIFSAIFVIGFAAGDLFGAQRSSDVAGSDKNLNDFLTAYHLVTQKSYYRPFDRKHLVYAAIDGMLAATGDPHTLFFSPTDNQVANRELNGVEFSGIGAIVAPQNGSLEIVAPLPNAPAQRAGLRPGDIVTAIDGQSVGTLSGAAAIARIHGRAGTIVRLTVKRRGTPAFTVRVTRAQVPPVTAYGRMLSRGVGYIQVLTYGDTTSAEVAGAISSLRAQHVRSLILDLRQNPGGYVDAAQKIVSDFVDKGVVAYEQTTQRRLTPLPVTRQSAPLRVPLAILVDGGTASAAEITAGALRDDVGARLFGSRTYGKGSMQSVYSLADGSTIRLTDRLWLTPHRHSIQGVGLTPDVIVQGGASATLSSDPVVKAAQHYLESRTGQ